MVTLRDIAELAGVSESTVSRALRHDKRISEATRTRILKLAQEKGLAANRLARALVLQKTNTVGLVLPRESNSWFRQFAWSVADTLSVRDYVVVTSLLSPYEAVKYLAETKIDGLILWGDSVIQDIGPDELAFLRAVFEKIPTITIAADLRRWGADWVSVDRYQAIAEAVGLLAEHGHERIVFLGRVNSLRGTTRDKVSGYTDAMEKHGLPALLVNCELSLSAAFRAVPSVVQLSATAVIAENSSVALGFQAGCWRLNVKVPDDISLIGYDNAIEADGFTQEITTVGPDADEMAEAIVDLLYGRMMEKSCVTGSAGRTPDRKILPLRWKLRQSVGPPPSQAVASRRLASGKQG